MDLEKESLKYLDSSKMKSFLECPRQFYWNYCRHLVPIKRRPALDFGKAIHEALYTWYSRDKEEDPKDVQEYAIDIFHAHWTDLVDDTLRTHEKGENLLRGYFKEYDREPFTFITPPETSFKIKFFDYYLIGRFDGVIDWSGMVMPLDHKTASRMGKYYFNRYRPDLQMTKYCWVTRIIAENKGLNPKVHGAYLNVLYFTKTKIGFERQIITREQWELDQFVQIALQIMDNINSRDPRIMEDWFPNWTSCNKWGACAYKDLCTTEEPERLVDFMYRKEIWNPLSAEETIELEYE